MAGVSLLGKFSIYEQEGRALGSLREFASEAIDTRSINGRVQHTLLSMLEDLQTMSHKL